MNEHLHYAPMIKQRLLSGKHVTGGNGSHQGFVNEMHRPGKKAKE